MSINIISLRVFANLFIFYKFFKSNRRNNNKQNQQKEVRNKKDK